MDHLFPNVLEISILTSVVILVFGLLSSVLGKRYGVKWKYIVWMILAIRLVMPVPIVLQQPIVNIPVYPVKVQSVASQPDVLPKEALERFTSYPAEMANQGQKGETQRTQKAENTHFLVILFASIYNHFEILWILGMFLFLGYQGKKYQLFLKDLSRNSRHIRDAQILDIYYKVCKELKIKKRPEILFCGVLPSPLCVGFFRQRIYLNFEDYKAEQLIYIFKHELMHCKRRDIWYKALLMLARGVHFFNPFIHWMARLAENDMEYSCDSLVLESCNLSQRQEYGLTILSGIRKGQKVSLFSTAFHGGKEELKNRIDHILDTRKKKRGLPSLLALALVVWLGTAFVGCSPKAEILPYGEGESNVVSTLYECKLDYIGNHVGVGKILGNLGLPKGIGYDDEGMELFTTEEPYGARQYLVVEKGMELPDNGWFAKNAMIFLALVENASFFEYFITDASGDEQILHFTREDGAQYYGDIDLRSMSANEETFHDFIQELDALFPQTKEDFTLKQIQSSILLDEMTKEMGNAFSYEALVENPKYQELLKLGDAALSEMLIHFGCGQTDDTKGYIMMSACLEILQVPVPVNDDLLQQMTPTQWYKSYLALDSMVVEPFVYDEQRYTQDLEKGGLLTMKKTTQQGLITRQNHVQRAVYEALHQRFFLEKGDRELQIYAPLICHISQTADKLSVYAVIGRVNYSLVRTPKAGYQLIEGGGSHVPTRLDFEKKNGNWVLKDWVEAKDGSEYTPSIKEMCKGAFDVANDLISYDTREMQKLLMQNLIFYLNGRKDITVYGVTHMEEEDIKEVSRLIPFVQA